MLTNKKQRANFFALALLYVVNYLFPFLTVPYLARLLTVEHNGIILYSYSFVLYFGVICDYSFNLLGIKDVVLFKEQPEKLNLLVSSITAVKLILFVLSLSITLGVVFFIPKFSNYWFIYLIGIFSLINNILYPTWFFRGMEEMKYITLVGVLTKVISVCAILIFIRHDAQYYLAPLFNTIAAISSGIVAQFILYKKFYIRYVIPKISDVMMQFKHGWHIFLSNISMSLYSNANSFCLGLLSTPLAVAYYIAAEKLIFACYDGMGVLWQVVFPQVLKTVNDDVKQGVLQLKKNLYSFLIIGGILSLILFFGSSVIVKLIFGQKYIQSIIVLQILAVLPLVSGVSNVLGIQTMVSFGLEKQFTKILFFAGLINLGLIFILVPHLSYIGSGIAVAITEIIIPIFMGIILWKHGINVWCGKYTGNIKYGS